MKRLFLVWRRDFRLVFTDPGVLLFFLALPTLYPVVYTLIYNPELVRQMEVAVIDNSRTAESREFIRTIGASPSTHIAGYASDKEEARRWMHEKRIIGVIEIPQDYTRRLGRGEQGIVNFYCEMSLLLRYRAFLLDYANVQLATCERLRQHTLDELGEPVMGKIEASKQVGTNGVFLGDTSQGFASFVMPGILILILQQSMILGITMLAGGQAERRRRNGGVDPLAIDAPAATRVLGKMLCVVTIYVPLMLYTVHIIPDIFRLPNVGNVFHYCIFLLPLLVASSFMGQTLGVFVTERETSMLVVVFTSVVYLFLSGLTWPLYSFNGFWRIVSGAIPATWGVEGFIHMASNGATIADVGHDYAMMWVLAGVYFVTAWLLERYYLKGMHERRAAERAAAAMRGK